MTEGMAIEIACSKMRELMVGKQYLLRYRHFQVQPKKQLEQSHVGELMILLTPDPYTRVSSRSGTFDLTDQGVSEQQYVFRGNLRIENLHPKLPIQVKFLQVIPILNAE